MKRKKQYKIQLPKGKKVTMTNVDFENGVMTVNVELENQKDFHKAMHDEVCGVFSEINNHWKEVLKANRITREKIEKKATEDIKKKLEKDCPDIWDRMMQEYGEAICGKKEQKYEPKDGDFLALKWKCNAHLIPTWDDENGTIERDAIAIFKEIKECDNISYLFCHIVYFLNDEIDNRPLFLYGKKGCTEYAMGKVSMFDEIKPATEEEKKFLIDKLAEIGKRWNEKEKRIEDIEYIPKDGDFVYICAGYEHIAIFKNKKGNCFNVYAECNNVTANFVCASLAMPLCHTKDVREIRPATEEEKKLLIDKLAERNKKWNAKTKQIEDVRWRAKEGEIYYWLTHDVEILNSCEVFDEDDDVRYEIGNYFKTYETAERVAKQIREIFKNSKAE